MKFSDIPIEVDATMPRDVIELRAHDGRVLGLIDLRDKAQEVDPDAQTVERQDQQPGTRREHR